MGAAHETLELEVIVPLLGMAVGTGIVIAAALYRKGARSNWAAALLMLTALGAFTGMPVLLAMTDSPVGPPSFLVTGLTTVVLGTGCLWFLRHQEDTETA